MAGEPSHVKQLSLNHVCKIGLRVSGSPQGSLRTPSSTRTLLVVYLLIVGHRDWVMR
jgi:hypothetical protein